MRFRLKDKDDRVELWPERLTTKYDTMKIVFKKEEGQARRPEPQEVDIARIERVEFTKKQPAAQGN